LVSVCRFRRIDLSKYTGKINIAFKYTGSGKNAALDGAFQVDDVQVFGIKSVNQEGKTENI
jgi:hypothetical protein